VSRIESNQINEFGVDLSEVCRYQRWPLGLTRLALIVGTLAVVSWAGARAGRRPYEVGTISRPQLLAENVISTEDDEGNGSFSPDGTEFYFTKISQYTNFPRWGLICVSRFQGGKWSQPEALPFSGRNFDFSPRMSPDGKTMFFSSSRPAPGKTSRVLRIWSVQLTSGGWGEPQPLPTPINAEDSWNLGASVTKDGTIYFASTREKGHLHIYRSQYVHGSYAEPEKLGPEINSEFNEADPFISPDEKILVFAASGDDMGDKDRPETLKGGGVLYARADLYVSTNRGGKWSPARHLEQGVNSVADEGSPSITPDGKYLFFTSERSSFTVPTDHKLNYDEIETMLHSTLNGHGNIFFISTDALGLMGGAGSK